MKMGGLFWLGVLGAVACGESHSSPGDELSTGGDTGGDDTGGVGGSGGDQQTSSGGTNASGGSASVSHCSGNFDHPRQILSGGRVTSPALTGDKLELFYVFGESGAESIQVTQRSSPDDNFTLGSSVLELETECAGLDASIDISFDGLRAYLSCYLDVNELPELQMLSRPDRNSPFGPAMGLGPFAPSAALSADELSIYGSLFDLSLGTDFAERATRTSAFSTASLVPGLEQLAFFSPTVSGDGLEIYGAVGVDKTFSRARRPSLSEPFGAPETLSLLIGDLAAVGAPELSQDCRTLVYSGIDTEGEWAIYQAER